MYYEYYMNKNLDDLYKKNIYQYCIYVFVKNIKLIYRKNINNNI